jgi:hypothetical protein
MAAANLFRMIAPVFQRALFCACGCGHRNYLAFWTHGELHKRTLDRSN